MTNPNYTKAEMQENKKINQKIERERDNFFFFFFLRENYAKNRKKNNKFIVKECE